MSIKAKEFDRLMAKFEFKTRDGADRLAWLEHDGRVVLRTRRSHGSGDLPAAHSIRQQLKLNETQLREAVSCSITRDGYIEILRNKGIL